MRRTPTHFPPKESAHGELRPWSSTLHDHDTERRQRDTELAAKRLAKKIVDKSKGSEREEWVKRAKEADSASRSLKLAQHFYHRPNVSLKPSAACLRGRELSNKTLAEMRDVCTQLQPDKPIGFTFQAISGDTEGRGTGQLVTEEALKDSNYRRVPDYHYTKARLQGVSIDCKMYNLSNKEAMQAAVTHCRVTKADGFTFFAQNELPSRSVTCFFKRLLSDASNSMPVDDLTAADAIVMDGLLSKGLVEPNDVECWTEAFHRIVQNCGSSAQVAAGRIDRADIVKAMCDVQLISDEQLERVLPTKVVAQFRKADEAKQLKYVDFIDAPMLGLAEFVSVMTRQETKLKEHRKKRKSTSALGLDSWTAEERREVQQRLCSPRSSVQVAAAPSSDGQHSVRVAGLDAADAILLEALPSAQRQRLSAAFRRIDGSNNGSLTKNELVQGLVPAPCHSAHAMFVCGVLHVNIYMQILHINSV